MLHPELPFFAFLAAVLVLIPLPCHWRARNIATLSIIFWLFIVDMIYGINAIIWAGNVGNPIPVWCDITTKIIVGASYALPLSTLCICKHLEMVSSSRKVSYNVQDRQRRMIFESVMCFGVPLIFMALHYIIQGHRFDIFEDVGCQAAVYISIQAVFLIWFPQLFFSVIALVYATLALHNFIRRRLTFAAHLQNSNSALTTNRYLRLIAMALTEMFWGTTLTAYNLWSNVYPGLRPWTNWADVHSNFSRVDLFVTVGIPEEFLRSMMLFWWTLPASSFIFFIFFGFGEDAMKEYKKAGTWFKTTILRRKANGEKGDFFEASLPTHRQLRPFHLADLNTTTKSSSSSPSSRDLKATSSGAFSHLSKSTITLPVSPLPHKKSLSGEITHPSSYSPTSEAAPGYYAAYPVPIDASICSGTALTSTAPISDVEEGDDTFTISTFSYYGSPSSPTGTAQTHFTAPHGQESTPHSPPPPRPPTPVKLQALSPPPPSTGARRPAPRNVPSDASIGSSRSLTGSVSREVVRRQDLREPSPTPSTGSSRGMMGIPGGGIVVTVQRHCSVDEMP